jgi:hypothetical protein
MGQCWILELFDHAIYDTCESQFEVHNSAVICHAISLVLLVALIRHPLGPLASFLPSFIPCHGWPIGAFVLLLSTRFDAFLLVLVNEKDH